MSLYAYAAAGLVALVLLTGTHWKAYSVGSNAGDAAVRNEWREAQEKFLVESQAKERQLNAQLNEARNAAVKREVTLRRDAAGARQSADGLRDELAHIRQRLPGLSADASRERADALADVLGSCQAEYRSLAETADRIANDRQTLVDAWPQ